MVSVTLVSGEMPAGRKSNQKAKGLCKNGGVSRTTLVSQLQNRAHASGRDLFPMSVNSSAWLQPIKMVGNAALLGHQEGLQLCRSPEMAPWAENGHNEVPLSWALRSTGHLQGSRTRWGGGCSADTGNRNVESHGVGRFSFWQITAMLFFKTSHELTLCIQNIRISVVLLILINTQYCQAF